MHTRLPGVRTRMTARRIATFLVAAIVAMVGLSLHQPAGATAATTPVNHVFVFMGENKSLDQMTGTPARDPYLLQTIKPHSAWFTNYHSLATGSLSQYIAITSGQYAECQRQGPCGKFAVPSIFSQLGNGGWKAWMESMPSPCYPKIVGTKANHNYYKNGHNPALWYKNLFVGSPTPCSKNDVPAGTTGWDDMSFFDQALAGGGVPRFNFISPNGCDGSYLTCVDANGKKVSPITAIDNFLKREIPKVQRSPACTGSTNNCLIVVTFDEAGATRGTHTVLAVMGPTVNTGVYGDPNGGPLNPYTHYSTLATIQRALGLHCLAGSCGTYTDSGGVAHTVTPLPIF
jgi:hypothetical protein